jgi:hypothetical protein
MHHVTAVEVIGDIKKEQYLNLLTFHSSKNEINIIFSENKRMCVHVSGILIYLRDLHDKYPTLSRPVHE